MIITVKNLQQQTFTVEFEPKNTVLELKKRILKEHGSEYVVEKQKLIYAGVILDDERTVASYNIDANKFIVVLLKRGIGGGYQKSNANNTHTVEIKSTSETATIGSAAVDAMNSDVVAENISHAPPTRNVISAEELVCDNAAATTSTATSAPVSVAQSVAAVDTGANTNTTDITAGLLTNSSSLQSHGVEYNTSVDFMIEMGFPIELIERAMAASFNNPERAIEYLVSGVIPDIHGFDFAGSGVGDSGTVGDEERHTANSIEIPAMEESENPFIPRGGDPLEILRNHPRFLHMRSLVYQNPDLLHAVLQQIGLTNPPLLQVISENQDAFLNMLNQPIEDQTAANIDGAAYNTRHITPSQAQRASAAVESMARVTPTLATGGVAPIRDTAASNIAAVPHGMRHSIGTESEHSNFPMAVNTDAMEQHLTSDREAERRTTESTTTTTIFPGSEGSSTIRLSQADQEAIGRLKALGFSETLVLQAYLVCERDEQLAANLLATAAFDD